MGSSGRVPLITAFVILVSRASAIPYSVSMYLGSRPVLYLVTVPEYKWFLKKKKKKSGLLGRILLHRELVSGCIRYNAPLSFLHLSEVQGGLVQ